jgi:hypothetical protein
MAQRKAKKGGGRKTAARARKSRGTTRKVARKAAPRKAPATSAAAARRIAELEAEVRRLRASLEALRAERRTPEALDDAGEGPPVLGL